MQFYIMLYSSNFIYASSVKCVQGQGYSDARWIIDIKTGEHDHSAHQSQEDSLHYPLHIARRTNTHTRRCVPHLSSAVLCACHVSVSRSPDTEITGST